MTERTTADEPLLSWRDALWINQQWNGEEPLLEVAEAATRGERGLMEANVELLPTDGAGRCRRDTMANRTDSPLRHRRAR